MTAKNCANGPKLVLKDLCEKSEKERRKKEKCCKCDVFHSSFWNTVFFFNFDQVISKSKCLSKSNPTSSS